MKKTASKPYTYWVILKSILATGVMCAKAVFKGYRGTISRAWVDKTMQAWVDDILGSIGVCCKVFNPNQTYPCENKATIIMCNHSSLYDIPISMKAFPKHSIRMLAKKELSKIPFMGSAMHASEFPFIDRRNRHQAVKDLEYAKKLLKNGIVLWMAPEGTRSKDGNLGSFKKGPFVTAIQAKATIIPIGIRGANSILPARTFKLNFNQKTEIHIGKPIDASEFSIENKEELVRLVREQMVELVQ